MTLLLGVALFAAGCTTAQPTAFNPEPIPPHPTGVKARVPQPPPVAVAPAPAPQPASFSGNGSFRYYPESSWTKERPIDSRLEPMGKITCITIHHEGDMPIPGDTRSVAEHLSDIRKVHVNERRWGDIGYHFLIDAQGNVWEGRPLMYQGAHAGNQDANRGNVGICLLGDFDTNKPTAAQKESLRKLTFKLMAQYNVPVSRVYTHREIKEKFGLGNTDCPGRNLQGYVNDLRQELRTAQR